MRASSSVDLPELRRLSQTMSLKWSFLDLPFGGCKLGLHLKPGVAVGPSLMRAFARAVEEFVRDRVFTGPDLGTTARDLRPFFDTVGQDSYDVTVARQRKHGEERATPRETYRAILGAIQTEVTGIGVARATEAAWSTMGSSLPGARVAIQGYGDVGRAVAEELDRLGARLIAIADEGGCLWSRRGLPAAVLPSEHHGRLSREHLSRDTEERPREAWVEAPADILIPAAITDAIRPQDVDRVQARLVVEAANIPVSRAAEAKLHRHGVLVLPDFLVNGGLAAAFGLLVTGEWMDAEAVTMEVIQRITSATDRVVTEALAFEQEPRAVAEAMTPIGSRS